MLFLSFDIKSLPESNSFRWANFFEIEEQEKVKGIPLTFFFSFFFSPLVVFNLGILFMERSLLPTCLLLLHLSPFRFLKIAKNTEFLSPKNTLTGKKGMHEVKKKYIYTVSPATWLPAHVWASVLSLDTSTDTCQIQRGRNKGHCWFSAEPMNTVQYLWEVGFATISLLIITGLWRVWFSLYYLKLKLLS